MNVDLGALTAGQIALITASASVVAAVTGGVFALVVALVNSWSQRRLAIEAASRDYRRGLLLPVLQNTNLLVRGKTAQVTAYARDSDLSVEDMKIITQAAHGQFELGYQSYPNLLSLATDIQSLSERISELTDERRVPLKDRKALVSPTYGALVTTVALFRLEVERTIIGLPAPRPSRLRRLYRKMRRRTQDALTV